MSKLANLLRASKRAAKGPAGVRQHHALEAALRERLGDAEVEAARAWHGNQRWTLEACKASASPYQTPTAWEQGDRKAYRAAYYNGWLDECCSHMAGALLESCKASALRFKSRAEWAAGSLDTYDVARRNGWLDECCAHMDAGPGMPPYLCVPKEECMASAARFTTRGEWSRGDRRAYHAARANGWLDECCAHMGAPRTTKLPRMTKEECVASAARFTMSSEWQRADSRAYESAKENGWRDECCKHMRPSNKRWTFEMCMASSLQYTTPREWVNGGRDSYNAARRNGWYAECCKHMVVRPPRARAAIAPRLLSMTKEECVASAARFKSRKEWQVGAGRAYEIARFHGWLDECCAHMVSPDPRAYAAKRWNSEGCVGDAQRG